LAIRELTLLLALVSAWVLVAPLSFWLGGMLGIAAAAMAAAVCLAAAAAALAIGELSELSSGPMVGLLLAMAVRSGFPLLFAVVVHLHGGVLKAAGLVYDVVLFYLLALAVEVPLSLPRGQGLGERPGIPRDSV
jgi:hypothetical protein